MWQIIISLWIGGLIGVTVMALMNVSSRSDPTISSEAMMVMEAQHKVIVKFHTTLVNLLHQSTKPDWSYELVNGNNKAFLTEVVSVIESINLEDEENGTDN